MASIDEASKVVQPHKIAGGVGQMGQAEQLEAKMEGAGGEHWPGRLGSSATQDISQMGQIAQAEASMERASGKCWPGRPGSAATWD